MMREDASVRPSDEDAVRALCELVQTHTGIQLGPQKHVMVRVRLERRLRALGLANFKEYLGHVERDASGVEKTNLMDLLTTNKTSFFREGRHFGVLAEMLRSVGRETRTPRLWSAACSSGEEPYTIALVACAAGVPVRILATDLSTRMLAAARAARYSAEVVADVPPALRQAHLVRRGSEFEVSSDVRSLVDFASLNLLERWPMRGSFDAIFCRNVMIYFDKETRQRLVLRLIEKLTPRGRLFVGLSESLSGLQHGLRLVEPGVYAR